MARKLFEFVFTGIGSGFLSRKLLWLAPGGERIVLSWGVIYNWENPGSTALPGVNFAQPFKLEWRNTGPLFIFLDRKMQPWKYAKLGQEGRWSISWQNNYADASPVIPKDGETFWKLCLDPGIVEYINRERFDALMSQGQSGWHIGNNRNWAVQYVGQNNINSSKPVVTRILSVKEVQPLPEDLQELRRVLIRYHLGTDADEILVGIWDNHLKLTLDWVDRHFTFSGDSDSSCGDNREMFAQTAISRVESSRAFYLWWNLSAFADDEHSRTLRMLMRRWGCEPFIERFGNSRMKEWLAALASADAAASYLWKHRNFKVVQSYDGCSLRCLSSDEILWLKSPADYKGSDDNFSRLLAVDGCFQALMSRRPSEIHAKSTGKPYLSVGTHGDKVNIWDKELKDFVALKPADDWFVVSRANLIGLQNSSVCLSHEKRQPDKLSDGSHGFYAVLGELDTGDGYFGKDNEGSVLVLRIPEGEQLNFLFAGQGCYGHHVWGVTVKRNAGGTLEFSAWDNGYLYELRFPTGGPEYVRLCPVKDAQ